MFQISFSFCFQTANKDTKVIEALNRLVNERVAALPIVDEDGRLINIFSKFDVFNLESFADLETSLEEVTKLRMFFDGVYSCKGQSDLCFLIAERKNEYLQEVTQCWPVLRSSSRPT